MSPLFSCCKSFPLQLSVSHLSTWSCLLWAKFYSYWRSSTFCNLCTNFFWGETEKSLKISKRLPSPAPLGTACSINQSKNSESDQSTANLLPHDLLQASRCKLHPLVSQPFLHFILELKKKDMYLKFGLKWLFGRKVWWSWSARTRYFQKTPFLALAYITATSLSKRAWRKKQELVVFWEKETFN